MLVIQYGAVHLKLFYVSILSCPEYHLDDIIIYIYALQCTVHTQSIHVHGLILPELLEFGSWWSSELDGICSKNRLMSKNNLLRKQHEVRSSQQVRKLRKWDLLLSITVSDWRRPTGRFFGFISDVSSVTFFSGKSKNSSFSHQPR